MRTSRGSDNVLVASDDLGSAHAREPSEDQDASVPTGSSHQMNEQSGNPHPIPPARLPEIELLWSNDSLRHSKLRLSGIEQPNRDGCSTLSRTEENLQGESRNSNTVQPTAKNNIQRKNSSTRPSTEDFLISAPASGSGTILNVKNRASLLPGLQSIQQLEAGLPTRNSGAGHGAGIPVYPDKGLSRNSWRDTWLSNPSRETRRSTVVLESFPIPPGDRSIQDRTGSMSIKTNCQPLDFDDNDESLSFETRRQRWHTERARARLEGVARFSNAGTSRLASSPRTLGAGRRNPREPVERSTTAMGDITNIEGIAYGEHSWPKRLGTGPVNIRVGGMPKLRGKPSIASSR
ncbi:hypothetical protein A1O3_08314 [Capronia epimyces CBS 606.96]|uniref:Uncharacterized protein n=1 Tax=Capronia epimyces CBS 606.96 TaxID=1182542 RepID=W9XIJ4_9EURO|nr:uncharacterized protein A1O3_08314 [Capronia epimyces CBS 606.96]EXJ80028.1 hypothetical protein A1O3_08314 [Capronia epimyces CBS 606.96]